MEEGFVFENVIPEKGQGIIPLRKGARNPGNSFPADVGPSGDDGVDNLIDREEASSWCPGRAARRSFSPGVSENGVGWKVQVFAAGPGFGGEDPSGFLPRFGGLRCGVGHGEVGPEGRENAQTDQRLPKFFCLSFPFTS